MGREIRRVPLDWTHPTEWRTHFSRGQYVRSECAKPLYDRDYLALALDWDRQWSLWLRGEHPDQNASYESAAGVLYFEQWDGPRPNADDYFPKWLEGSVLGYAVYETVSEGTPVTPTFATQAELIEYLVANGDFWDQKRRAEGTSIMNCDPWSRDAATRFVMGSGWAPSMIVSDGVAMSGVEAMAKMEKGNE